MLRKVLLRESSVRPVANVEKDSPDLGVGAAELPIELIDVMVLVRLELTLEGTGGGGMARSVELLAMLCNMVAPRMRLLVFGGFG